MLYVFRLARSGLETESAPVEPQLLLNNAAMLRGGVQATGALAGAKMTETAAGAEGAGGRRRSRRSMRSTEFQNTDTQTYPKGKYLGCINILVQP